MSKPITRQPGAQPGNSNCLKHGLRSKRFGLSLGKPPRYLKNDWSESRRYQALLEQETVERYGGIDIHQAGQIMTASIHSLRMRLAKKWLEQEGGPDGKGLALNDRIALLNLMGNAADSRDKVVERLFGKPCAKSDPWAVLDAQRPVAQNSTAVPETNGHANGSDHADE